MPSREVFVSGNDLVWKEPPPRIALPWRRIQIVWTFTFTPPGGVGAYDVEIAVGLLGREPEPRQIIELFVVSCPGKVGQTQAYLCESGGKLISHLLQLGMTPLGVRRLLSPGLAEGAPSDLLMALCDQLVAKQAELIPPVEAGA
ncbi:MAG: hypothetical protein ACK4NA_12740 [Alphaproteobacteria bacterium]